MLLSHPRNGRPGGHMVAVDGAGSSVGARRDGDLAPAAITRGGSSTRRNPRHSAHRAQRQSH
eukprot:4469256-Lingulodinium_polyedra.AAC.1